MNNNWKYASLGERERLSMIKNGNSDVYNTEKERNKQLKQLRSDLGLSTDDIDNWDNIIDSANASANDKYKVKNTGLPKFKSARLSEINARMRDTLKGLKKQRDESIETAKTEAEQTLGYISEWLASNGYSKDGSFSVKSEKAIKDALESMLRDIESNYKNQVKSTVSKYHSMV